MFSYKVAFILVLMALYDSNMLLSQGFDGVFWLEQVDPNEQAVFRTPYQAEVKGGLSILPFTTAGYYNTSRAWGPNNGSVWQGRGGTLAASFGVRYHSRFLDIQLEPVFLSAGNLNFRDYESVVHMTGGEFFTENYSRVNYRERIAPGAIRQIMPGNSWFRLNLGPVSFGISTENVQWGPGRRNPLLMSNNAPGFEHLTFHTNRPLNIILGSLQTHMMVGHLKRSYFDDNHLPEGTVSLSGLNIGFSPWFSENLHIGLIRTFTMNESDIGEWEDYVPFFQSFLKYRFQNEDNVRGNDSRDQRASVYVNWYFPDTELALYGEYARDDHSADLRDLYVEPNHTRAFMLGVEKKFRGVAKQREWIANAEIVHTEYTNTSYVRQAGLISFYSHDTVRQGYTHYGQMIGTYYGAGGNGWFLSVRNQREQFGFGLLFERVARNKDIYQRILTVNSKSRPELELVLGLSGTYELTTVAVGRLKFFGALHAIQYKNKFYIPSVSDPDGGLSYYNPLNINMQLAVSYFLR